MKPHNWLLSSCCVVLLCIAPARAERELVPVGVAQIDITPQYPVRLSGYGRRRTESEGVEQPIWAKALAIGSDADPPAVLITVDNCGVPATVTDEVAARLAKKAGVARARVAVCSSHTHCAPMLSGVLPLIFGMPIPADQQARIDRYTRQLTDKLEQVALAALADRRPSRLGWDVGKATFAINRRALKLPMQPPPMAPVDHSLPVLRITDSEGNLRAVLVRYACHATTVFGEFNRICGDWPGYAQAAIQRDHPGAIAMVAIGCGADSKPNLQRQIGFARQHGEEIAGEVNRLLKQSRFRPINGRITARLEHIDLPFAPLPTRDDWLERSKDKNHYTAYHAQVQLRRLDRGESLATSISYPVQSWAFGDDLAMVFLAGEVVVDYALRLSRQFDAQRLWVNAYANDVPCYIPSKRVLSEGGYEPDRSMLYYDRPTRFADQVEDLIFQATERIVPVAFHAQPSVGAQDSPPAQPLPRIAAVEPNDAAETIHTPPDFRLELIAAEPLVTDPVAIKYDEYGRAYVAEMGDYPYSDESLDRPYEDQPSLPLGRIRILEDTDGDGRFDKSTIFADKLSWPTGLALWKGGVYVSATPDILYLKDTDGDGQADVRRKVFSGFRKYNVQAVINNLQWGLDHRIYGAGSSNGGTIRRVADPASQPIRMGRGDFCIDPRNESFELMTGGGRFGNTFDDWGNRFICNIRNPVRHVVLENRYLARNSFLPVRSGMHDSSDAGEVKVLRASAPEPWRVVNAQRKAADPESTSPISEKVATGYVTSATGITIYRGGAYPRQYYNNAFVGEVAGNLVMRYVLQEDGPSFRATRVHEKYEFLAATDNWFRPVNFVNAPDGTLHVLDMYRETIEHPWSIPDDIKARVDLLSGRDRGRIYRLAPVRYRQGFTPPPRPRLGRATIQELVAQLESPNSWWRETAHRLIFERQDAAALAPLAQLLRNSDRPTARLHALWSIEGLSRLSDEHLLVALSDPSPRVREHAVRLTESRLKESPRLQIRVLRAADDPDQRVRFQTALTLGELGDARAAAALARIARRDGGDIWMRTALLSSLSQSATPFLLDVLSDRDFAASGPGRAMVAQLTHVVAARSNGDDVAEVLAAAAAGGDGTANWIQIQLDVVTGIGAGLKRANRDLGHFAAADTPAGQLVARILSQARRTAESQQETPARRRRAIQLIGYSSFDSAGPTLTSLLDARQPQEIQTAAVETMSGFVSGDVAPLLLEKYAGLSPAVRRDVVTALLSRGDRIMPLLDALEQRKVSARLISPVRRLLLMQSSDTAIAERAKHLFGSDAPRPRNEVVARYTKALSLPSDALRGEAVLRRECLSCHRLGLAGHDVGPNFATIAHRSPADVLVHILDPNREVSPNFLQYVVVTNDGRIVTGVIASETATSITLRAAENKEQTILRRNIDTMTSSGKSLMPEGLEQKITPQEAADLLEFLLETRRR